MYHWTFVNIRKLRTKEDRKKGSREKERNKKDGWVEKRKGKARPVYCSARLWCTL
jgi:hypothetical protein